MAFMTKRGDAELGLIAVNADLTNTVSKEEAIDYLNRHAAGDHGEVTPHEMARCKPGEVLSAFTSAEGIKVFILTSAEWTIVFPESDFEPLMANDVRMEFIEVPLSVH